VYGVDRGNGGVGGGSTRTMMNDVAVQNFGGRS
jgi:hypothetical protein